MKNVAIAFVAMFLIFSCTPMKKSATMSNSQPTLVGTSWKMADKVSGKVPTLVFEEGKVSGNAGCNNFFGMADVMMSSGKVSFSNMGSTKMICADMSVEDSFMMMLPKINKYVISGNTLELYQDKLLLMKFNKTK